MKSVRKDLFQDKYQWVSKKSELDTKKCASERKTEKRCGTERKMSQERERKKVREEEREKRDR